MNRNRASLSAYVADSTGFSPLEAYATISEFFDVVEHALKEGETVQIRGFGTWEPVQRAAKAGRNPRTGDLVPVPARMGVRFKPVQSLLKSVNEGEMVQAMVSASVMEITQALAKRRKVAA